jgi:hypothetical protein
LINLGQVVAALAAGALLTIAVMLLLELHGRPRRPKPDSQQPEAEPDDREWRIEAMRNITVDAFEAIRQLAGNGEDLPAPEDLEYRPVELPHGTRVVRSKRHLHLIGGAVAAIITVSTAARDALRQHPALIGAAASVAAAGAVTTLTLTPWTTDNDAGPPRPPTPSATSWPSSTPPPGSSSPRPSGTASPTPSASPTAPPTSTSPSPSPSSTSISPSPATPGASPSGKTPSAPQPAQPAPNDSGGGSGRGTQEASPPGLGIQGQDGNGRQRDRDEEDKEDSEQNQHTGQFTIEATLCADVAAQPLLDVGACLGGRG